MKYVIYEMIQPEHLQKTVYKGYGHKTVYRNVLEELDVVGVESTHPTIESAISEIIANKDKLKQLELTILPKIRIAFDGEIL